MDWPLFITQWLHVLAGITWFGAAITTNMILVPALNQLPIPDQQRFGEAYGQVADRVLVPVAVLVIALGILRGTVFGQLHSLDDVLGTTYGLTWLVGMVAALLTLGWSLFAISPAIRRLNSITEPVGADGRPTPELLLAIGRAKRNAILEILGFAVASPA